MESTRIRAAVIGAEGEIKKNDFASINFCAQKENRAGVLQGELAKMRLIFEFIQNKLIFFLTRLDDVVPPFMSSLEILKVFEMRKKLSQSLYDELETLSLKRLNKLGFISL